MDGRVGNKEQNLGYNMDSPRGTDLNFNLCLKLRGLDRLSLPLRCSHYQWSFFGDKNYDAPQQNGLYFWILY